MPSRRDLIKMTPDEVHEFVHGRRTMAVATIGRDGRPHVTAMWYGFLDESPAFETYAKSQKVQNLLRDPRITCLIEDGELYEELRGVELVGHAEVSDDEDVVMRTARSVVSRYHGLTGEAAEAAAVALARKRVSVKINVEKVVSWDHSKLGGTY